MNKNELYRLKERINSAFMHIVKLHEQTMDRDAAIVGSLLETQLGKLKRLIVKKATHENLKTFQDELNEPFEPPEILLSLKPESVWRQMSSAENTLKSTTLTLGNGAFRRKSKPRTKSGTRSNSNKKS